MSTVSEPNASEPLTVEPQAPSSPKPWGYFSTFGWAVLANVVGSTVAVVALYLWNSTRFPFDLAVSDSMKDATYVSATTLIANIVQVGLLILVVWLARWKAKDYLALNWPGRQEVAIALVVFIALLPILDGLAYLTGQPIIPPFIIDIYRNAQSTGSLPLLWLAIVVAAPIAEEIIFRGFIFRGWVRSPRYAILGILVVAAVFAIIHIQYNWFGVLQVFLIGLTLTWVRWRSGSTLLPMVLHVMANFYAMMQTVVFIHWLS
jgi:membrane protease YdiL (CAAX protease family)